MVNTLNTCPTMSCSRRPKAMKLMLAAFIISSIDMRMMMALRRVRTPAMPIENSSRLNTRAWWGGIGTAVSSVLLARQDDGADHRHEQEDRGDLERQQVIAVQSPPDLLEVAALGRQVETRAVAGLKPARHRDVQEQDRGGRPHDGGDRGVHADARPERVAQVHQHDDEQERDHDSPGVPEHLDR